MVFPLPLPDVPLAISDPGTLGGKAGSEVYAAIEIDLFISGAPDDIGTVRLCNRAPLTFADPVFGTVPYEPRLDGFTYGTRLSFGSLDANSANSSVYGRAMRGSAINGSIDVAIDDNPISIPGDPAGVRRFWQIFDMGTTWCGRPFRAYTGICNRAVASSWTGRDEYGPAPVDMRLIYTGRIGEVAHDTLRASLQTADTQIDFDKALINNIYDDTFPEALRGRPKPRIWGQVFSVEPVLIDQATLTYQICDLPVDDITEVRVGGVSWDRVAAAPSGGQWLPDLAAGTIQLGSITRGLDVRCDAVREIVPANPITGSIASSRIEDLFADIVALAGGQVDPVAMAKIHLEWPLLVGYATGTQPVNVLNELDRITSAAGLWWATDSLGRATAGANAAPSITPDYEINDVQIASLSLSEMLPPAWRIRIGYRPNQSPVSTFAGGATDLEQSAQRAPNIVYEPHYEVGSPTSVPPGNVVGGTDVEPRAFDIKLDSIVPAPADALFLQTNLQASWGIQRRIWDMSAWVDPEQVQLYDTVFVRFPFVESRDALSAEFGFNGSYRVIGVQHVAGGGAPARLTLWG